MLVEKFEFWILGKEDRYETREDAFKDYVSYTEEYYKVLFEKK
jgi:hypothetical protein